MVFTKLQGKKVDGLKFAISVVISVIVMLNKNESFYHLLLEAISTDLSDLTFKKVDQTIK